MKPFLLSRERYPQNTRETFSSLRLCVLLGSASYLCKTLYLKAFISFRTRERPGVGGRWGMATCFFFYRCSGELVWGINTYHGNGYFTRTVRKTLVQVRARAPGRKVLASRFCKITRDNFRFPTEGESEPAKRTRKMCDRARVRTHMRKSKTGRKKKAGEKPSLIDP